MSIDTAGDTVRAVTAAVLRRGRDPAVRRVARLVDPADLLRAGDAFTDGEGVGLDDLVLDNHTRAMDASARIGRCQRGEVEAERLDGGGKGAES